MMRLPLLLLAAILLMVPARLASAQSNPFYTPPSARPPDAPPPVFQAAPVDPGKTVDEAVNFSHAERWLIPYYFTKVRSKQERASRSKKPKRALPEGLDKVPEVGQTLSPGILSTLRPLPGPLVRDLPPRRPDTERYIVGSDVLLVRPSTGEVLDKLGGVI